MKLLAKGAEANIYAEEGRIIKERIKKEYRVAELDNLLRKQRTRYEARLLRTAKRAGLNVPDVLEETDTKLIIEKINGEKLRDYIERTNDTAVFFIVGSMLDSLHKHNIIHGDFTTSNIIYNGKIIFIDFGLGEISERVEDKAIDLHVLKECLISKHHTIWEACWQEFLKGYKHTDVIRRLEKVERRGRYKRG